MPAQVQPILGKTVLAAALMQQSMLCVMNRINHLVGMTLTGQNSGILLHQLSLSTSVGGTSFPCCDAAREQDSFKQTCWVVSVLFTAQDLIHCIPQLSYAI